MLLGRCGGDNSRSHRFCACCLCGTKRPIVTGEYHFTRGRNKITAYVRRNGGGVIFYEGRCVVVY